LKANYEFEKKTSKLHNSKYYREIFLEIQKFLKVKEEYIEVQKEKVRKKL